MRVNKRIAFFVAGVMLFPVVAAADNRYSFNDEYRDPFAPLISQGGRILIPQEETISNFALKGIIYSEDQALAIINDEVLRVGDNIGDYTILKVEPKRVILKNKEEEVILKLEEE